MRDDMYAVIVAVTVRTRQRDVCMARLINEASDNVDEVRFITWDDEEEEAVIGLFHRVARATRPEEFKRYHHGLAVT